MPNNIKFLLSELIKKFLSQQLFFKILYMLVPLLIICVIQSFRTGIPAVGDEPVYIYNAFSFFSEHDFSISYLSFIKSFPQFAQYDWPSILLFPRPVLFSLLGAPFVGMFGVAGGRLFSCLCGLVAYVAVYRLVAANAGRFIGAAASLFVFITFPVLAYSHLFYTDIASLAAVSWAWMLAHGSRRTSSLCLATVIAISLPFFHIRMSLVSALLVLFVLMAAIRAHAHFHKRAEVIALIMAIVIAGFVAFIWHQYERFGSIAGGASGVATLGIATYFERLALQALDFRHGLITYNPAMIVAVAGLIIGLRAQSRIAFEGMGLLLIYSISFVWGAASESLPARFWVSIMPVFAAGLGLWLKNVRGAPAVFAASILFIVSLVNLGFYLHTPIAFLENRQASLTYDDLFNSFPHFNFAGFFPWDPFNYSDFGIAPHPEISFLVMLPAAAFVIALTLAFVLDAAHVRGGRFVYFLPAALILLPLWGASMQAVPADAMKIVRTAGSDTKDSDIVITFCRPIDVALIQFFGQPRALMIPPTYPSELIVSGSADGEHFDTIEGYPMSPIIDLSKGSFRAIRLSAHTTEADRGWVQYPLTVLVRGAQPTCRDG